MSCAGCSISSGSPKGCGSNGGCSTGGCNRLNTYDWLADISFAGDLGLPQFVEVSFKNGARKAIYKNPNKLFLEKQDCVAVEAEMGSFDVGVVSLTGEMARLQMKRRKVAETAPDMLRVLRIATEFDIKKLEESRALEYEAMVRARAIARQLNLNMKVGDVEYQGDGKKATFFYIADERVDFRELIKAYAKEFKVKIEMNHIGARQEAGRIGGIGSCGRELCCSTWLTDFKTVSTSAARYQNLSINQVKLSGQCGRLKCCLNYELDTYLDALKDIPQTVEKLETETGVLFLQKTDIFKKIMWFAYKESTVFHPLTTERVTEIDKLNKSGIKPADLGAAVIEKKNKPLEKEPEFTDVVGQTSLDSLGKKKSNNKKKNRGRDRDRGPGNQNRPGQQPRGNQPQRPQGQGGQQRQQGRGQQQRPQGQPGQQAGPQGPQQPGQPPKPQGPQQPGQEPKPGQQQPRRNDNRNQPRKPKW